VRSEHTRPTSDNLILDTSSNIALQLFAARPLAQRHIHTRTQAGSRPAHPSSNTYSSVRSSRTPHATSATSGPNKHFRCSVALRFRRKSRPVIICNPILLLLSSTFFGLDLHELRQTCLQPIPGLRRATFDVNPSGFFVLNLERLHYLGSGHCVQQILLVSIN